MTVYIMKVSSKGQVVIPVEMRRRLRIRKRVAIREERGKVIMEPFATMEDSFGAGGKVMYEVAREISEDRRKEVESEVS